MASNLPSDSGRVLKMLGYKIRSYQHKIMILEAPKNYLIQRTPVEIQSRLASASPPLGPLLGQYGLNIAGFCKEFNTRTEHMKEGIPLPCMIQINPDKTYKLQIRLPTAEYYLMQAAGISRGKVESEDEIAGKITLKHLYEIAKILHGDPNGYYQIDTLQDVCNQLIKKAREIGIDIVRDLNPEEYSAFLKERKEFLDNYDKRMQEIQEAKLMRTA